MTTYLFHAVPLTPIHIGDGTALKAEEFLIEGDRLLRFNPIRVIADMPPDQQQKFIDAIGDGRLKDGQRLVRQSVKPDRHVFERISVGRDALQYLGDAVNDRARRGEASPFIRMAGRPFIPGSSLKGAFRTALVSDRATAMAETVETRLGREVAALMTAKSGALSDRFQHLALDYVAGATEGDPLRDVAIADAPLGSGATRFDKVTVGWTPRQRDAAKAGRQLHVERLLAVSDRCPPADVAFTVRIAVTDPDRQHRRRRLNGDKTPRAPVGLPELLQAADNFHKGRWDDEMARLFPGDGSVVRRRLLEALGKAKAYAATLARPDGLADEPPILLRLGRFTGFESKSVDTWRRGWSPQRKDNRRIERAGTHSLLVDGNDVLPFGWLFLCPAVEPAPERTAPPRQGGSAAPRPQGAPPAATPALHPPQQVKRAFVGEEEVKVLETRAEECHVRFIDTNDTEWVKASEVRYE